MLTFDEFKTYMLLIKAYIQFENGIESACAQYREDTRVNGLYYDECTLWFPTSPNTLCVELLEKLMYNKKETIQYYVYELRFGQDWKPGMIVENGVDIKLQTLEDLYQLLLEEAEKED